MSKIKNLKRELNFLGPVSCILLMSVPVLIFTYHYCGSSLLFAFLPLMILIFLIYLIVVFIAFIWQRKQIYIKIPSYLFVCIFLLSMGTSIIALDTVNLIAYRYSKKLTGLVDPPAIYLNHEVHKRHNLFGETRFGRFIILHYDVKNNFHQLEKKFTDHLLPEDGWEYIELDTGLMIICYPYDERNARSMSSNHEIILDQNYLTFKLYYQRGRYDCPVQ